MGPILISTLFTVGAATWIFNKAQRYSGNNTRQSVIVAGISAALIFIIFLYLFSLIPK